MEEKPKKETKKCEKEERKLATKKMTKLKWISGPQIYRGFVGGEEAVISPQKWPPKNAGKMWEEKEFIGDRK